MIHGRSAGLAGPSKAQAVKPRGVARLKVSSRRPLLCLAKAAKQGESGWPTVRSMQGLVHSQQPKRELWQIWTLCLYTQFKADENGPPPQVYRSETSKLIQGLITRQVSEAWCPRPVGWQDG